MIINLKLKKMKKLIKFALLVLVVAVFTFSNDQVITKIRTGVVNKATELFKKGDKVYDNKEAELKEKLTDKFGENAKFEGKK